jgi:hypothetical protein
MHIGEYDLKIEDRNKVSIFNMIKTPIKY